MHALSCLLRPFRLPARCALILAVSFASTSVSAQTPTTVRTLYLIRHGIYDPVANVDETVGNTLNPLGREQAALVATRLAALPVKFSSVTSSQFARARETGDIIAAKLGATCQRDPLLNETIPAGVGLPTATATPVVGAEAVLANAWTHYSQPAPGAPRHDLLVCHGNVIRWFVCKALGVDTNQWTRMEITNASLTVIAIKSDGTARLEIFNEVAHLPIAKQTWSGKGPGWDVVPVAK